MELTAQGSQLEVGDTATVAYEPRQGVVGVLDITVTRLEKTSFKKSFVGWDLDQRPEEVEPLLRARHDHNVGDTDLGGTTGPALRRRRPDTLVEADDVRQRVQAVRARHVPQEVQPGDEDEGLPGLPRARQGDLTAVSFRPTEEFDPITWTGDAGEARAPKPDKPARATRATSDEQGDDQPSDAPS